MRYLSSISLALIVLMALACAEPTTGAFSCQELADKLAAAQTEMAAVVLTRSWNDSGCAQRAAGVTKVPTARPTARPFIFRTAPTPRPRPTMTKRELDQLLKGMVATSVPTPAPTYTPVPPTDCVRVETTDARLDSSRLLHLHWRITNICDIPILTGQTIVFYDKDKNMLGSQAWDSFPSRKLHPMESKLFRTFTGYQFAGGDAFHSYEIEVPWKPD